jgi:SAM-dependent methyltransferase
MSATILHAGCGGENLPSWLATIGIEGREIKLDIDAEFHPDHVASIDDLGDIGPFDAVFTCHCLEHLHWYRAMKALSEFYRVLKPGGVVIVEVPDLTNVKPDDTVIYTTPGGLQITGLDMHYGFRDYSYDNPYMMHGCGFMPSTMQKALEGAGFKAKALQCGCDILGIGVKPG